DRTDGRTLHTRNPPNYPAKNLRVARRIARRHLSCRATLRRWAGCYSFQISIITENKTGAFSADLARALFEEYRDHSDSELLLVRRWRPQAIPPDEPTPPGARRFRRMRQAVRHT